MRHSFVAMGIVIALNAAALGQCSVLAVSGSLNPGETITVAVGGATPNALTFLFAGSNPGSTTFGFGPLGSFTIDLDPPFLFIPIGSTDGAGNRSVSVEVPSNAPSLPPQTFVLQ